MSEFSVIIKNGKGPCGKRSGEPNPSQCSSNGKAHKGMKDK